MSSAIAHRRDRTAPVQRPGRALSYGLAIWFVWTTLVVVAFEKLPAEVGASAFFVSMKVVALVTLVLASAVHYVWTVAQSSVGEGLLIGLSWTVILVALDLTHYLMAPFDVVRYLTNAAPAYAAVPITTTLVMGFLERRPRPFARRERRRDLAT
jgi:hypothetical protein